MFHTDADGESVARLACYCTNLRRTEGGDVMPAFASGGDESFACNCKCR